MRLIQNTDLPGDIDTVEKNLMWSAMTLADKYSDTRFEEVRGRYELAIAENVFPVDVEGSQNPSRFLWIVRAAIPVDNEYRQRMFPYQSALPLGAADDVVPLPFRGS